MIYWLDIRLNKDLNSLQCKVPAGFEPHAEARQKKKHPSCYFLFKGEGVSLAGIQKSESNQIFFNFKCNKLYC